MDQKRQNGIRSHFDKLYKLGITPWKNHPAEPMLGTFFGLLKDKSPRAKLLDITSSYDPYLSLAPAHLLHYILQKTL